MTHTPTQQKNRDGFTLIELIVALTLFSVLVVIAIGGFTRALQAQRRIGFLVSVNSNASLALEQIARDMRVALGAPLIEDASGNTVGNGDIVHLTLASSDSGGPTYEVWYRRKLDGARGYIEMETNNAGVDTVRHLTADTVDVQSFVFSSTNGGGPPITVTMKVAANTKDPALAGNSLNLEMSVWPRR